MTKEARPWHQPIGETTALEEHTWTRMNVLLFLHIFLPLRFLLKCHLFREAFLATPL